jgi:hypothetical protein
MYQTPFADRIRNEVGIQTIAVGAITQADQANSIIAAGRADLCAVARPHLADPAWTLHEAAALQSRAIDWPRQYLSGRDQMYREIQKQQEMLAATQGTSQGPLSEWPPGWPLDGEPMGRKPLCLKPLGGGEPSHKDHGWKAPGWRAYRPTGWMASLDEELLGRSPG